MAAANRVRVAPPPKSVHTGSKVWPRSVSISASLQVFPDSGK
jgi:hypothetical protein